MLTRTPAFRALSRPPRVYFDRSFAAVFPFLNLSRMKLEYWMAKETELFRQGRNPTCERNICVCVYVTHVSSKGHGVHWWCCYCRCYVSALSAHLSSNWRKHLIRGAPLGRQRNENSLEMTVVTKELYRLRLQSLISDNSPRSPMNPKSRMCPGSPEIPLPGDYPSPPPIPPSPLHLWQLPPSNSWRHTRRWWTSQAQTTVCSG